MPDFGNDRVMACSQSDMLRWIRGFTGQTDLVFRDGKVQFTDQGVDFTVTIEELPIRKLGMVKFQDSRIQFSYPNEQEQRAREWIRVFDHHTQRGGG